MQRAMGEHISHYRDRGCGLPRSRSSSVLFCQHCSQHVATAMPCPPSLSPPRCFRLCRGFAPLLRFLQDAAKSQCSPAPPGRPRLRCMCVCVWGDVMFLCRSMCFLLSGWLSLAMRLLQRSIVSAVVLLAFSVSDARVVCCSPSRLRMRYAVCCPGLSTHPTHGTHTHLTQHTDYAHTTHSPHTSYTPYTTPHHIHSSHTTPRNIHAPHTLHTTHTTITPHTTRHSLLRKRKSEMVCSGSISGMHFGV